jgi:hypothetical protein
MESPTSRGNESGAGGNHPAYDTYSEKLRNEIVESEKSQADILKWKLISIAGVASVSLGVGSTAAVPEAARLLICLVPLICIYVDLISLHIMMRIITIGFYLKESGNVYEQFAFEIRHKTAANPFVFDAVVLHGSSLVFNAIILVLSLVFPQTLPNWPSAYTTAYVLAGILGIIVTLSLLVMYKMRLKEVGDAAEKFFANLPK